MKLNRIKIPYAGRQITVAVPESRLAGTLSPRSKRLSNPYSILKEALENPSGAVRCEEWLKTDNSILIIVNDATRPTPTAAVLEVIRPWINPDRISFLVAAGTHRAPMELELQIILGSFFQTHRDRITVHDCHASQDLMELGTTSSGTRVFINRLVPAASRILIIGSVEPHYFAGFTGGRKGLIPGVAGYETIEQNHSHAMSERCAPMKLEGNPVHEDILEGVRFLEGKQFYSIQTVLDPEGPICAASAGDLHESMNDVARKAAELFGMPVTEKADVVIAAAAPPLDCNLYQSQKALEHARLAVRPGGIIILVAACRDGIGPDAFFRLLTSHEDPEHVLDTIRKGYKLGHHKAARWISLAKEVSLYCVTELDPDQVRKMNMLPFETLQHALDRALRERDGKVLVMPSASVTVPVLG